VFARGFLLCGHGVEGVRGSHMPVARHFPWQSCDGDEGT
jgi:hypothetical protein